MFNKINKHPVSFLDKHNFRGSVLPLYAICKIISEETETNYSVMANRIRARLCAGWAFETAISEPVRKRRNVCAESGINGIFENSPPESGINGIGNSRV